ncbi:HAD family acid phosphatase [Methylocystis sp. ATCC 49242]|uniref:phosphatase domain-containing protein n=1 Tax=Methylocystis sp. ATCC 49242 TaxID=622637 RepID=UPI00210F4CDE|nr:HAD family acid phosphatase [Methylocystis sp. ATCC 49242]
MRAWIFDLDKTMADSTHRAHHLRQEHPDFDAWRSDTAGDSPISEIVEIAKMARSSGVKVIVITGRREADRCHTSAWLDAHGIAIDAMFMRPDGLRNADNSAVKRGLLYNARAKGYRPVLAFDDHIECCGMYLEEGVRALWVAQYG